MMGVCFECLVEIDGELNQQSCQIGVTPGMTVMVPGAFAEGEDEAVNSIPREAKDSLDSGETREVRS